MTSPRVLLTPTASAMSDPAPLLGAAALPARSTNPVRARLRCAESAMLDEALCLPTANRSMVGVLNEYVRTDRSRTILNNFGHTMCISATASSSSTMSVDSASSAIADASCVAPARKRSWWSTSSTALRIVRADALGESRTPAP